MTQSAHSDIPTSVGAAFGIEDNANITPLSGGLINSTWLVESAERKFVLQRLHDLFKPEVNAKIEAVTAHLQMKGVNTTSIIRTNDGSLSIMQDDHCWRGLSYLAGHTELMLANAVQARSVGQVLAEFHSSLQDFPKPEQLPVSMVHDIGKHCMALERALKDCATHRNIAAIEPIASSLRKHAAALPPLPSFPPAIIHGDPKTANFLFAESDVAEYLIDLDTVSRGQLLHDLGDAFRSWCNPRGEDTAETFFDLSLFDSALEGYLSKAGSHIDKLEIENLPTAIETIYLELGMRFCADALLENYFAWDPSTFRTASDHQLTRALGQLHAYEDCLAKREEMHARIAQLTLE